MLMMSIPSLLKFRSKMRPALTAVSSVTPATMRVVAAAAMHEQAEPAAMRVEAAGAARTRPALDPTNLDRKLTLNSSQLAINQRPSIDQVRETASPSNSRFHFS